MKLTPWFDGSQKPVRVGMYQRRMRVWDRLCWSWWDGQLWSRVRPRKAEAYIDRNYVSVFQNLPWRGLAHKGKG